MSRREAARGRASARPQAGRTESYSGNFARQDVAGMPDPPMSALQAALLRLEKGRASLGAEVSGLEDRLTFVTEPVGKAEPKGEAGKPIADRLVDLLHRISEGLEHEALRIQALNARLVL